MPEAGRNGSWRGERIPATREAPGPVGRFIPDLFLPAVLRFSVTDESMPWMYDYRVADDPGARLARRRG